MYSYPYPMCSITTDLVLMKESGFRHFDVLTIKRKFDPFKGMNALPGGFVELDKELIQHGLVREMQEEIHLDVMPLRPTFVGIYDRVDRDDRGRVISICYRAFLPNDKVGLIKAGDDAESFSWVNTLDIEFDIVELAYDHKDMVMAAKNQAISELYY